MAHRAVKTSLKHDQTGNKAQSRRYGGASGKHSTVSGGGLSQTSRMHTASHRPSSRMPLGLSRSRWCMLSCFCTSSAPGIVKKAPPRVVWG